jgi:hypothetical protein
MLNNKAQTAFLKAGVISALTLPGMAHADGITTSITSGVCQLIAPIVGGHGSGSQFVSLIFLIALGSMIFMWWMSENKEGVMIWLLRTGIALGVLINLFTLPSLLGLPAVC